MFKIKHGSIHIGADKNLSDSETGTLKEELLALKPWRKGPFNICGIEVDTEWRSDLKWDRMQAQLPDITDKEILDIGASSGYYMFRLLEHDPKSILGIDPYTLYYKQFELIQSYLKDPRLEYQNIGFQDLEAEENSFDLIFCMGILYHHPSPIELLKKIKYWLKPGGTLILEGLYISGDHEVALTPKERYAGMRNVYFLPTLACLENWLMRSKFKNFECLSTSVTNFEEQHKTDWIDGYSLEQFLDSNNPEKTREGYERPKRFIYFVKK